MKHSVFSSDKWAKESAILINKKFNLLVSRKNKLTVMLAGGQSAKKIYTEWAKIMGDLHGCNVSFYISDERCVELTSPHRNSNMIINSLFEKKIPRYSRFIYPKKLINNANISSAIYEKKLPKQFDLAVLSAGPDGHIASIFHNSIAMVSPKKFIHIDEKFGGFDRVTITLSGLQMCKNIYVLVNGQERVKNIFELTKNINIKSLPVNKLKGAKFLFSVGN